MPTLIMCFPGRRYHATPWGHHVNEGMIEWPPSPWRIIRALLSVGYAKGGWNGTGPPEAAHSLIMKLSGVLPAYALPRAVGAHTRHYMPMSYMKGGKEAVTLVFDTWAQIDSGEMAVCWDVQLEEEERRILAELTEQLSYLGRAESWVEARLAEGGETLPEINCHASDTPPDLGWEQVSLLAPLSESDYSLWRQRAADDIEAKFPLTSTGKKQHKVPKKVLEQRSKALAPYPQNLMDALQKDTSWWREHGWSLPPGSRRVFYLRKKDALVVGMPSAKSTLSRPPVQAMLLSMATATGNHHALPPITHTLFQGERLHKALVSLAGGYNRALSGRDETGKPLGGRHEHAHFLPLDLDTDGHIDHMLIWTPMGLDDQGQKAVRNIRKTYAKGVSALYLALAATTMDIKELMELTGVYGERLSAILGLGGSKEWISHTPFVPPRHLKARGKNNLEGQVQAELESRGHPVAEEITIIDPHDNLELLSHRHFRRIRTSGPPPPIDCGFTLRLKFKKPLVGPLCLGYGSHYGLGLFAPKQQK